MLGAALAGARVAEPGETALTETPAPAAPAAVAPPEYLDDHLVVDSRVDRTPRRWPWVVMATILAVLVGAGAAVGWSQVRTASYEVPPLVGLTEAEARAAVERYGFEVERRDTRQDGSVPGDVLDTQPEAGERLDEGATLVLFVSLGNTPAPVPTDLAGKTLEEATAALDAAGQFTPDVTEVTSEEIAAGIVIEVGADVADELPKGSQVPLVVSKGPRPRAIPTGLDGKSYEEAAAALDGVQLRAKKVEEFSDDVEAGQVIGLRPASGTVARDSEVEVVVSKGPDLVTVPTIDGRSLEQAIATIEAAGLEVGDVSGPARGQPFVTDPVAGQRVRRGETVDIFLRR